MVAVDEAAMRLNLIGSDAYMEQWRRGDWQARDGTPQDGRAPAVAAEVEAEYFACHASATCSTATARHTARPTATAQTATGQRAAARQISAAIR